MDNKKILETINFKDDEEKNDFFDDSESIEKPSEIKNKKIYRERQDKALKDIARMVNENEILLQPDFQRNYVWTLINASQFIESLFLQIPIPTIFLFENKDSVWEVIDGQQRLTTIYKFLNDEFHLKNLTVLTNLNGKKFSELEEMEKKFLNKVTLQFNIIDNETDEKVKYDVFSRINRGAVNLNAQELRNCLYRSSFSDMIKEISSSINEKYNIFSPSMQKRQLDNEIILRFFLINSLYKEKNNFENYTNISEDMNEYMVKMKEINKNNIVEMKKNFNDAFLKVKSIFGENMFKYWNYEEKKWSSSINRAVFEIQMCLIGEIDIMELEKFKFNLESQFKTELETNGKFRESLKIHTNNRTNLIIRFNTFKKIIENLI